MAKSTLQLIASVIAEKYGLKGSEASAFIAAFFEQICNGLDQDKQVKVRGLGTFKCQAVKARESVNVNTGERLVISGHEKMAFTPDNAMKELVNRPFADFETVMIQEGVDIESIPTPAEEESSEDAAKEMMEEKGGEELATSSVEEKEEEAAPKAAHADDASEDVPTDVDNSTAIASEDTVDTSEEQTAPSLEKAEQEVQPIRVNTTERPLTASERFSQMMGEDTEPSQEKEEKPTVSAIPSNHNDEKSSDALTKENQVFDDKEVRPNSEDSTSTLDTTTEKTAEEEKSTKESSSEDGELADETKPKNNHIRTVVLAVMALLTLLAIGGGVYYNNQNKRLESKHPSSSQTAVPKPAPAKAPKTKPIDEAKDKNAVDAAQTAAEKPKKDSVVAHKDITPEGVDLEAANRYRALRYGAYRIVGIEKKVVLRKGETVEKLCHRTLGKDMMSYFEAVNGKGRHQAGDTILVPKVELRPEYRK